jgi:hypothetical protein
LNWSGQKVFIPITLSILKNKKNKKIRSTEVQKGFESQQLRRITKLQTKKRKKKSSQNILWDKIQGQDQKTKQQIILEDTAKEKFDKKWF